MKNRVWLEYVIDHNLWWAPFAVVFGGYALIMLVQIIGQAFGDRDRKK